MIFRRENKLKIQARLDLTSMIDVVFLLILFFMLSSTFVVQSTIPIELPEAQVSEALEEKDVSITLAYGEGGPDGKGPVYLNETPVATMQELSEQLSEIHAARPDVMVLIRGDANENIGRLVEVMGIANSVGIRKYGIAAQPPENTR